jgi:putative endonuclease
VRPTFVGKYWFVYIIQSEVTGRLYTGATDNPLRRLGEHNGISKRGAKATRAGRPWKLVYLEPCPTKGGALHREYEVKSLSREKRLALARHCKVEEFLT